MQKNQNAKPQSESKVLVMPGANGQPPKHIVLTGKTLGKGQYGVVHYAHMQDDHNKVFAVKVIDRKRVKGAKALQNLQNEIAIMAEIRSPNVVALRDATKTMSNFYLVMELCNGGDLQTLCALRNGYLKEEEARSILRQMVRGIAAIKAK